MVNDCTQLPPTAADTQPMERFDCCDDEEIEGGVRDFEIPLQLHVFHIHNGSSASSGGAVARANARPIPPDDRPS
jgi:hypothetical protein